GARTCTVSGKDARVTVGSQLGRGRPQVHVDAAGERVDLRELLGRQRLRVQCRQVLVELLRTRGADECRDDHRVTQGPLQRQLCERLPAALGDVVEAAQDPQRVVGQALTWQ